MTCAIFALRLTIAVALAFWSSAAFAQVEPLALQAKTGADDMRGHLMALRDPGGRLTPEEVLASEMVVVESSSADFGYTSDVIWLRLDLTNASPPEEALSEWRVRYRENFLPTFGLYQVAPDGTVTLLEEHVPTTTFSERTIPYAEVSVGFTLPPGEATTLLTRFTSRGQVELSFSIKSALEFEAFTSFMTARNFAFYGMMTILILAAVVLYAVQGQFVFAAYACYAASALLFVMHADGNTFRFFWPNAPLFNGFASAILGTGLIVFGAVFARHFLQTFKNHPVLDILLRGTILAALAVLLSAVVVDQQLIKRILILGAFGSVILFAAAGFVAARTRFREVRFYLLAWIGGAVSAAIMTARHWIGLDISEEVQYNSIRVVLTVDAAMMGFAIIDRINQIKRAQQQALERSLAEARRNLRLSERLQGLERQYQVAQDLARSQSRQVADTMHDLRGPLHALRLNLQTAANDPEAAGQMGDLEQTFTYLETLVNEEMSRHTGQPADAKSPETAIELNEISTVLTAVFEMFAGDAQAKGLHLIAVPSSASTTVPPFALMRILSNLVSNAVRYTEEGRVLIGIRHGGALGLRLEVHDTGPGLRMDAFAQALERAERLGRDGGDGHGLGLSIVQEAVAQNGLDFGLVPGRKGGTGFYVTLTPKA